MRSDNLRSCNALSAFDKLFYVYHGVISVYLTNRCNIECAHCGVSSGPREKSRADSDVIAAAIKKMGSDWRAKAIHVGGGEPFMLPADLERIGDAAGNAGLLFGVTTNAFWGKNEKTAQRLIQRIPALTNLLISTDSYHQAFIPIETVVTAIRVAREMKIDVDVYACGPQAKAQEIQDELLQQCSPWIDSERIHVGIIEAVGRGADLPEAVRRKPATVPTSRSCEQLKRPVIVEDGTVLACCNTTIQSKISSDSPVILGNIRSGVAEICENADNNQFLKAMRIIGPKFIIDSLPKNVTEDLKGILEDDLCSACEALNRNKEIIQEVRIALEETAIRTRLDVIGKWFSGCPNSAV